LQSFLWAAAGANEEFIANGEADMVGMTTPFFADAQHIKKASEGRFDDIFPCHQCHDCHGKFNWDQGIS